MAIRHAHRWQNRRLNGFPGSDINHLFFRKLPGDTDKFAEYPRGTRPEETLRDIIRGEIARFSQPFLRIISRRNRARFNWTTQPTTTTITIIIMLGNVEIRFNVTRTIQRRHNGGWHIIAHFHGFHMVFFHIRHTRLGSISGRYPSCFWALVVGRRPTLIMNW